ncbi:hypothetical protein DMENIID0001_139550 [Sergentomyia squamirostris]
MKNKSASAENSGGAKKRKSKVNHEREAPTPKEKNESINGHEKGDRPFKCEMCTRTFNIRQALSTHMRLHRLKEEESGGGADDDDVVDFESLIDETRTTSDSVSRTTARTGSKRKAQ